MSDKPDWYDAINQQFINTEEIHRNLQLQLKTQKAMFDLLRMRIDQLEQRQQKTPSYYVSKEGVKEIR